MLFLSLCLLGAVSSVQAQNRPLRLQFGGNYAAYGSISLDVKTIPKHAQVFSVYAEELLSRGYGGGYGYDPTRPPLPATSFDSFNSIGISLRQPVRARYLSGQE